MLGLWLGVYAGREWGLDSFWRYALAFAGAGAFLYGAGFILSRFQK